MVTVTWQETVTGQSGSQTVTQSAGRPWQQLASDVQQQWGKEDEWSSLLYRDPPFPFIPGFQFEKQPGIITHLKSYTHAALSSYKHTHVALFCLFYFHLFAVLDFIVFLPVCCESAEYFFPILSAKISLTKKSSMDRLLQPVLTQQDDWYLYFDRISALSSSQRVEKPCESLCVEV